MGWNGSGNYLKREKLIYTQAKPKRRIYYFITVVVLLIVLVLAYFMTADCNSVEECLRPKSPKRVTKSNRKSNKHTYVSKLKPIKTSKIDIPKIEDANIFLKPKIEGKLVVWKIQDPPVFTNQFEDFVATVLTTTPGERFLETDLSDDFDNSFFESLKHSITIEPDDSDVVIAMKNAVIEAREEVSKLVAEGFRPSDIVLEARSELNKIADYRDNLQAEFNNFLITATDPKDVFQFRNEANAILQEYGASPIDGPHDEETAYEMMLSAKEEKIQQLDNESSLNK